MDQKPFWEEAYRDKDITAFSKTPTTDVVEFYHWIAPGSTVLDVGCGEGRNAIFLAGLGHHVQAFDLSEAGIEKAKFLAAEKGVEVQFWAQDLADFVFEQDYDVILSHGVLHLAEKDIRNAFIQRAQEHTKPGGLHFVGIFTNRLPIAPDMESVTKSLFDVGELPAMYQDWDILNQLEYTFRDKHPGGIRHKHAYERLIARKPESSAAP